MNKILLTVVVALLINTLSFAQAYEGIVEFDKKKQDAFLIDYSYSPEAVENAIVKKMEMLGYKPKEEKGLFNKDKGFKVFKGAYVTEANPERLDYIIKVESKSKKNKDESVVSMILLKDGNNAKVAFAATDIQKVKSFLKDLMPNIEAADLEIQIRNSEEALTKAEKKLTGLKDEKTELEKKLSDNQKGQEDTQKDIEAKKIALEVLRSKRKS